MNSPTLAELLDRAKLSLEKAGITSARLDSVLLLEKTLGRKREWLLANPDYIPSSANVRNFQALVARRGKREPLAYITKVAHFYGLELEVSPAVLIPRPETESLAAYIVKTAPKNAHVLEVGTGSGAIALALRTQRPDLRILATDVSSAALAIARRNAAHYRLHDIEFQQSNIMDDITGRFDVIVANLPYLPIERRLAPELAFEPREALIGGRDGLDHYRQLFDQAAVHLGKSGQIVLEAEPEQGTALDKIASAHQMKLRKHTSFLYVFTY